MTSTQGLVDGLDAVVTRRFAASGVAWWRQTLERLTGADPGGLAEAFTAASRKVGRQPLALTADERHALTRLGMAEAMIDRSTTDEAARIALLLAVAVGKDGLDLERLVDDVYQSGDNSERQAVLRALALLPEPERFVTLAAEACRSHVQPLFEAIACENPYPAAHFPELNFNQMVIKALFTGVPLARVIGLAARITPELVRMANDYASERTAAGRSVPPDIALITSAGGHRP
ncbi:MAG: EboA domain-containing protein [Candidatus Rokubacteria bacterium]|nr:EboA domain-containing protein [Candidatus Rokubacteria bacterium]MBI3826730.1 EboA domain-containing protein [Candidatus Rokubacteria bacterium]